MSLYVIVGAGATGSNTALLLAEAGEQVRLVSRRGSGPQHPLIERIAVDATHTEQLIELTKGAKVLINCAMPAYDRWAIEWPPLAASLLATAERTGASYLTLSNTYGYGPVEGPLTEDQPMAPTTVKGRVRAQMWHDALDSHQAGRIQTAELRASEYLGADAVSPYTIMVLPQVLAGLPASFLIDVDVPHHWTYTGDVARTLVALAQSDKTWGRAWHVPSTASLSARDLTNRFTKIANINTPELTNMSAAEVVELGKADAIVAALVEILYLYEQPQLFDSSHTEKTFDLKATHLDDVLTEMAVAHKKIQLPSRTI